MKNNTSWKSNIKYQTKKVLCKKITPLNIRNDIFCRGFSRKSSRNFSFRVLSFFNPSWRIWERNAQLYGYLWGKITGWPLALVGNEGPSTFTGWYIGDAFPHSLRVGPARSAGTRSPQIPSWRSRSLDHFMDNLDAISC